MPLPQSFDNPGCDLDRFHLFALRHVVYKKIDQHEIHATILTPKDLRPGKYPVMVRWHGGGLVNGHRLFAQWIAPYILTHALQTQSIVILPDYRLLPEAGTALEILEDARDLFSWLSDGNLTGNLPTGVRAECDNVLVSGESAGGWLALQSAFVQKSLRVAAIIAQYPMIDMRDGHWTAGTPGKYLQGSPLVDLQTLDHYFESLDEKIITSRIPPRGGELYIGLVQQGLYGKVFGEDRSLYPLENLDTTELPPLWLLHGSGDSIVPISGSVKFIRKLRQRYNSPVCFTIRSGEEHLFDTETHADQDWVQEGLSFIGKYWPTQLSR